MLVSAGMIGAAAEDVDRPERLLERGMSGDRLERVISLTDYSIAESIRGLSTRVRRGCALQCDPVAAMVAMIAGRLPHMHADSGLAQTASALVGGCEIVLTISIYLIVGRQPSTLQLLVNLSYNVSRCS
jgi:hypothetical protein